MDADLNPRSPSPVARRWDPDKFAALIRSVVDAPTVAILAADGKPLFVVGEKIDLVDVVGELHALTSTAVHTRAVWPEGLGAALDVGDWLAYEVVGDRAQQFLVVVGAGDRPEGDQAVALVVSGTQERHDLIDEIDDMGELVRYQAASSILACITRAQRDFILDGDARQVFARLLDDVLKLTQSEYGFIGEVEEGPDGRLLRTWAITNIAWTDELHAWFEQNNPKGLEFTNLDTLFGAVIRTGEPVVANDPGIDPRRGGCRRAIRLSTRFSVSRSGSVTRRWAWSVWPIAPVATSRI